MSELHLIPQDWWYKVQVYLDYLDYLASAKDAQTIQVAKLRFDLLAFANETLVLSVPACVKLPWITDVLTKLDDYWRNGSIRLQLDGRYNYDSSLYFSNRMAKLEQAMDEDALFAHFEYLTV